MWRHNRKHDHTLFLNVFLCTHKVKGKKVLFEMYFSKSNSFIIISFELKKLKRKQLLSVTGLFNAYAKFREKQDRFFSVFVTIIIVIYVF